MTITPEIRAAYVLLTDAGYTVTPPRQDKDKPLAPMVTHDKIDWPQYAPVAITIADPNHFHRTIKFARENGLAEQLGYKLLDLLSLLTRTAGKQKPKLWESQTPEYETGQAQLYPDGYTDPGFGWQGCGMVGGFIFHSHAREWSIHT